jgi:hypothetical protein
MFSMGIGHRESLTRNPFRNASFGKLTLTHGESKPQDINDSKV